MGFFSSLVSSPKVKTPASGFYAQPQAYQSLYNNTLSGANGALFNNGQFNTDMFSAAPQNQFETAAQGMIQQGVTPTAQSLQSDISMLTNPFDDSVINGINREATGQNSLVNQAATLAGQQGSNRSFLGTSDVEQNRLNNIGMFKQSQYNNAVNQSLGQLSGLRQQDIQNNQLQGEYQRGLDTQNQQAPLAALQAALSALGGLGTLGVGNQKSSSGGGLDAGRILNTAGTIAGFFSDKNLKENIEQLGEENGHKIYKFNYKGDDKKFIGVIAQEVAEKYPEAITYIDGYLAVNYDHIGVEFREAK